MKQLFLLTSIIILLISCNSSDKKTNTKKKDTASYYLYTPNGWTTEHIPFPIEFAPNIHYKGTEELRFTKGWGDIASEEHWSYAFAWWLDGEQTITADTLQKHLTEYYTGLVGRNIEPRHIPKDSVLPVIVSIKAIAAAANDKATYAGTISMLDYLAVKPIVLNCMVHVKNCNLQSHTALLIQISPQLTSHPVWKGLNELNEKFSCGE